MLRIFIKLMPKFQQLFKTENINFKGVIWKIGAQKHAEILIYGLREDALFQILTKLDKFQIFEIEICQISNFKFQIFEIEICHHREDISNY